MHICTAHVYDGFMDVLIVGMLKGAERMALAQVLKDHQEGILETLCSQISVPKGTFISPKSSMIDCSAIAWAHGFPIFVVVFINPARKYFHFFLLFFYRLLA